VYLKIKLFAFITTFLLTVSACAAQEDKLIFAIDVIRHGDRTPITEIPQDPHQWHEGLGQLTALGMLQEYHLGESLRKRYVEEKKLLPTHYEVQTVHIRSSDYDRTLMSAEALLLGLYPLGTGPQLPNGTMALPSAYQPIPIHTVDRHNDTLFLSSEELREQLERYVFTRPDWKQKTAELQPQFARWSQLTGINIHSLHQLISLGDTLLVRKLHKIPLPSGITEEDEKTLIEVRDWGQATYYKSADFATLSTAALLKKINEYLELARQHQTKLKYVLFSGHDGTILGLLGAMHLPQDKTPTYASDLNFSLYETPASTTVLKITLNGELITVPHCGKVICSKKIEYS